MRINQRKCNYTRVNRFRTIYSTYELGTSINVSNSSDSIIISGRGIEGSNEYDIHLKQKECVAIYEVLKAMFEGKEIDIEVN